MWMALSKARGAFLLFGIMALRTVLLGSFSLDELQPRSTSTIRIEAGRKRVLESVTLRNPKLFETKLADLHNENSPNDRSKRVQKQTKPRRVQDDSEDEMAARYLDMWPDVERQMPTQKLFSWRTRLLSSDDDARVFSYQPRRSGTAIRNDLEPLSNGKCHPSSQATTKKFTVILSANGAFTPGRNGKNAQIVALTNYYLERVGSDYIDRFILSWNPSNSSVGASDVVSILRYIAPSFVPVELVLHGTNKLENRFAFGNYACTEHILHLDDDIFIPAPMMLAGFALFRDYVPDRLLGYYCANYGRPIQSDGTRSSWYHYVSKGIKVTRECNMVLTGLVFLNRRYHYLYHNDRFAQIRQDVVEKNLSGEDILMNFVVGDFLNRTNMEYPKKIRIPRSRAASGPRAIPKSRAVQVGSAVHFSYEICFDKETEGFIGTQIGHSTRPSEALWGRPRIVIGNKEWNRRSLAVQKAVELLGPVAIASAEDNHCIRDISP